MRLRWAAAIDRLRSSLFVEPMLFVIGAVLLAAITIWLDERISAQSSDLPLGIASTVESARSVLSTIAGATITVAGIAFSVALLVVQLASSQYSPRVVQGLFRDPFNKRVMGVVVGTFTYCLVVLRSVRSALEDAGEPVIPNVSVTIAVVLGIASILAIVAFINHNAHTMDVSEILHTVTAQTLDRIRETWPERDGTRADDGYAPFDEPDATPIVVRSRRDGWVQFLDHEQLLEVLPERATARLHVGAGQYATCGSPLCSIWLAPGVDVPDPSELVSELETSVRSVVHVGRTRTMAQDAAYGVRQLSDVALRALSPGVNDPTTAQDAIFHLGSVLAEAYRRCAPPARRTADDGRTLVEPGSADHDTLTHLAFGEIRRDAASHPRVAVDLLETIATLLRTLSEHGNRAPEAALREEADLVLQGSERSGLLPHDVEQVRAVHRRHFAPHSGG
jgi:uncharacterized membrane protein